MNPADGSQGATGAGGSETPGPVDRDELFDWIAEGLVERGLQPDVALFGDVLTVNLEPLPPIDHTDPLPPCPTCGAQPGGYEHVEVSRDQDEVTGLVTPGVVIRRTVVIITYPWEDA